MEKVNICAKSVEKVIGLELVESTQDLAKELLKDGETDKTLVLSCQQTKATDINGKPFVASEGGIYFSLIIKRNGNSPVEKLLQKTTNCIASLLNSIFQISTKVSKNEILALTKTKIWKKIAGVKIDSILQDGQDFIIVGVGVYLNNDFSKEEQKNLVSLKEIIKAETSKELILTEILNEFWKEHYFWEKSI